MKCGWSVDAKLTENLLNFNHVDAVWMLCGCSVDAVWMLCGCSVGFFSENPVASPLASAIINSE